MVDQSFSRLVFKLDSMMAEAGYARSETTRDPRSSAAKDARLLRDMIATVHPGARPSAQAGAAIPSGDPRNVLTYSDGGVSQAS
ncbi:hypothetical protein BH24ACT15_BH24ACT15_31700 [soil metagenome]